MLSYLENHCIKGKKKLATTKANSQQQCDLHFFVSTVGICTIQTEAQFLFMKIFGNIHSTIYVLYLSSLIEKKNSCDLVQLSYQIGLLFSMENFFSIRIQREVTYILILVQLPSGEIEKLLPAKYKLQTMLSVLRQFFIQCWFLLISLILPFKNTLPTKYKWFKT